MNSPSNNASNSSCENSKNSDLGNSHLATEKTSDDALEHKLKLANGIPVSILVLAVLFGGWYFENELSKLDQGRVNVLLAPSAKESAELESVKDVLLVYSAEVKNISTALYRLIENQSVELEKILESELLSEISMDDRASVLVLTIKKLVKDKRYADVITILTPYDFNTRVELGVQFSYAYSHSKLGNSSEAIIAYKELLSKESANQSAILNLGYLYLVTENFQAAEQQFTDAISKTSGIRKSKAYSGLADSFVRTGRNSEAVKAYKKSIEYRPSHSLTWRKLARVSALDLSNNLEVKQIFEKAIALDKNNVEAYLEYSRYLMRRMDFPNAISQLKKARKLSRNRFQIRYLLVACYSMESKRINAGKQLKLAEKIAKKASDKLQVEAMNYYLAGEYRLSIDLFKGLLKKKRNNNLEYYFIGLSYFELGKTKSSRVYLDKIVKKSSFYYSAELIIANILLGNKDYQGSMAKYLSIIESINNNEHVYIKASEAALKANDFLLAKEFASKAIAINRRQSYQLRLAEIYWLEGKKQRGIEQLRLLIEEKPRYLRAKYRLAVYLRQNDELDKAINMFNQLLAQQPDYGDAQLQLARLYFQSSQLELSQSLLEQYLTDNIESKKARLLIARVFCELGQLEKCQEQLQLLLRLDPNYKPAIKFAESIKKH